MIHKWPSVKTRTNLIFLFSTSRQLNKHMNMKGKIFCADFKNVVFSLYQNYSVWHDICTVKSTSYNLGVFGNWFDLLSYKDCIIHHKSTKMILRDTNITLFTYWPYVLGMQHVILLVVHSTYMDSTSHIKKIQNDFQIYVIGYMLAY